MTVAKQDWLGLLIVLFVSIGAVSISDYAKERPMVRIAEFRNGKGPSQDQIRLDAFRTLISLLASLEENQPIVDQSEIFRHCCGSDHDRFQATIAFLRTRDLARFADGKARLSKTGQDLATSLVKKLTESSPLFNPRLSAEEEGE